NRSPETPTMRTLAFFLAVAFVVLCSGALSTGGQAPDAERPFVGDWTPIRDVYEQRIQELGRWAVAEHVKAAHDGVRFSKVTSGEEQAVTESETNYRLVIDGADAAGKDAAYAASVFEGKTRELLAFGLAN
ncbi:hypothetical protein BRADI_2g12750v3, partial [Brachypodium distachyon]